MEVFYKIEIFELLLPLLSDKVEPIQQSAIIALGRVLSKSEDILQKVIRLEEEFESMREAKDTKSINIGKTNKPKLSIMKPLIDSLSLENVSFLNRNITKRLDALL